MNQEQYMEMVLEHYANPRNYGDMESPSIVQEGGNPGCGDTLKLYLKVGPGAVVEEVSFSGEGCMLSQAGASIVPAGIVLDMLGKKLVSTRPDCARLGLNTLKKAVKKWQSNQMLSKK